MKNVDYQNFVRETYFKEYIDGGKVRQDRFLLALIQNKRSPTDLVGSRPIYKNTTKCVLKLHVVFAQDFLYTSTVENAEQVNKLAEHSQTKYAKAVFQSDQDKKDNDNSGDVRSDDGEESSSDDEEVD